MKKLLAFILICVAYFHTSAQSNTFPSSGNVGIGTTSPSQILDVRGHIYTTGSVFIDGGDLVLKRTTYTFGYVARPNVTGYKKLQFAVEGGGPLEDLYVNSDRSYFTGNVGIGESNPVYKLQINGSRVSIIENGEARYHLFNGGGITEWLMGQKSNTLHNYTISTSNNGNEVDMFSITPTGNVGIGTINPQAKLAVNGDIFSKKVRVTQTGWSDYVFEKNYRLLSLSEVEKFIQHNNHLPGVPSEKEVQINGLDVGDNQAVLLKKIEELTLYIIELNKKIEEQLERIKILERESNIPVGKQK